MRISVVLLGMVLAINGFAQQSAKRVCTEQEAKRADSEIDALKDWEHLYRWYQRFQQCDDGAYAEGYSDAVAKLLADDWNHFPRLLSLTKTDKRFQQFVLKHIDETIDAADARKMAINAKSKCPAGGEVLCRLIARAANTK
jgi:hypothetical protein